MLGLGGTAFWSTLFTILRTVSACSVSSGLMVVSTFAVISVVLMLVGVTAKFSPSLSRVVSASLSVLEDRLMTQFVWSTLGVEVNLLAAFCSRRSFLNICFCRSLGWQPVEPIAWRRLSVSRRNVAFHIKWPCRETTEQTYIIKLLKVFFSFCFRDDGDLRLKREEIIFYFQNRCGLWLKSNNSTLWLKVRPYDI